VQQAKSLHLGVFRGGKVPGENDYGASAKLARTGYRTLKICLLLISEQPSASSTASRTAGSTVAFLTDHE
jgi:hypothetical protein